MTWTIRHHQQIQEREYAAPETGELNEELGILDLSADEGVPNVNVLLEQELFPEKIVLRLRMSPTIHDTPVMVTLLSQQDAALGTISLYDPIHQGPITGVPMGSDCARYSGIDLLETGVGAYELQGNLYDLYPSDPPAFTLVKEGEGAALWHKAFAVTSASHRILSDPGRRMLMPFGMLYYPGISPEMCQQIYAEVLLRAEGALTLGFTAASLWRERCILPPHLGRYDGRMIAFRQDPLPHAHRGLGEALISGEARIKVQRRDLPVYQTYVSRNYTLPGGHSEFLEVVFRGESKFFHLNS